MLIEVPSHPLAPRWERGDSSRRHAGGRSSRLDLSLASASSLTPHTGTRYEVTRKRMIFGGEIPIWRANAGKGWATVRHRRPRDRLCDHPSPSHPHCACISSAIPLKLLTCLLDILLNAVSSMHSPSCPLHACTGSLTYCLFRQLDLIHLVRLFSIRSKLTMQEAVKAHPEEARMGVSRPTLKKYVWRPMQPRNADHKVPRRQVQDRHVLGH